MHEHLLEMIRSGYWIKIIPGETNFTLTARIKEDEIVSTTERSTDKESFRHHHIQRQLIESLYRACMWPEERLSTPVDVLPSMMRNMLNEGFIFSLTPSHGGEHVDVIATKSIRPDHTVEYRAWLTPTQLSDPGKISEFWEKFYEGAWKEYHKRHHLIRTGQWLF